MFIKGYSRHEYNDQTDFQGALETCNAWIVNDAEIYEFLDIHEDWSMLLTMNKLHTLIDLPKKPIKKKIWINAIWFENQWYQILRFNGGRKLIREYIEQGDAEVIPQSDLDNFEFDFESYHPGDSLVYDPYDKILSKKSKGIGKVSFICTHKKENKAKVDVSINVINQDDEPLKKATIWIKDKVETYTTDEEGNVELGEVEVGTTLDISAGYSADYVLGQDIAVVSRDQTLPIKIKLQLETV